jgi:hypothetical protein
VEKNREKLAKYPPKIIEAVLDTLVEFSPIETSWESIWAINARVNEKLISSGYQSSKPITGVKIGNILRLLGFDKRKRFRLAMHCQVSHEILRQYLKEGV